MLRRAQVERPAVLLGLLPALVGILITALLAAGGPSRAGAVRVKGASIATQTYQLTQPDQVQRLTVTCPAGRFPLGGGMLTDPTPSPDGEGVYPRSYERLGVQSGWHVTGVLFDPSHGSTTPRSVTLQVLCARKPGPYASPRKTVFVKRGQTESAVARCPGRRRLIGGGFQRTDLTSNGGDFITESRAIDAKSWRVTAHAFGVYGGELTAIAYCLHSRKRLVTTVAGSVQLSPRTFGTAHTGPCPRGRRIVFGGFRTDPAGAALFTDGVMNADGTWSASGFARFSPANLTAYGYCLAG